MIYYEDFQKIDDAYYREQQVKGWNRKKKLALINGETNKLSKLSLAYRDLKKILVPGLRQACLPQVDSATKALEGPD